jgi:hypothetical protein
LKGAVSEKFCCNSEDDNRDGLNVQSIVQVGSGGTPGITWGLS